MKRIVSVLLALTVLAALAIVTTTSKHTVRAVYAQSSGCTDATLNANYAVSDTGFATPISPVKGNEDPIAIVGVFTFDGAGNFSSTVTLAFLGVITTNNQSTGTYTVNSDCTGSISFTAGAFAPANLNMVIIGGGTEVFGIVTSPSATETFDAKKQ